MFTKNYFPPVFSVWPWDLGSRWTDTEVGCRSFFSSNFHCVCSKGKKEVKEHIEKYTFEIIKGKETKFLRDQAAHDGGYAYKWNHFTQSRHYTKESGFVSRNIDVIIHNLSSASSISSSQSIIYHYLFEDRVPKKKKGRSRHTITGIVHAHFQSHTQSSTCRSSKKFPNHVLLHHCTLLPKLHLAPSHRLWILPLILYVSISACYSQCLYQGRWIQDHVCFSKLNTLNRS